MSNQRKRSIRTRILVFILLLLTVTFLLVQAVFNYLVRDYTLNSVKEQLANVLAVEARRGYFSSSTPAGSAKVLIITDNYDLVLPDLSSAFTQYFDEMYALAVQMKQENVSLRSNRIMNIQASGRDYYYVSVNQPNTNIFFVYYIDMTAIAQFADRINTMLLWVMGLTGLLAVGLAFFLSGVIARPIQELTRFANRIGRGDFSTSDLDYQDAELAELAESMNKAATQLDLFDKEQKTFFQNVSHELRTPLQAIRSNAEGMEHGILESNKSSKVIISETDRLSELVEDLLYLSRMDSISGGAKPEEHDLRELLSNSAERQSTLAAERGIAFAFQFDEKPVEMRCDETGITRAFANLIANAIRYAASRITLSCRRTDEGIVISVADDGSGIAPEDLPNIFKRFYKGRGGKHGIGLSIVKAVIEQHGGKISAANDGGAVITIFFPGQ